MHAPPQPAPAVARADEPAPRVSEPGDAALVRRAQRGSREAGAALFARHWEAARRAALAITGRPAAADDVAQAAFVRAFAALDRFDPDRAFAPWLHRIVVNGALDHLRAERRLVPVADPPEPPPGEGPGDAADADALAALARLSPERRAVVVLRHLLDYRPPEIAEVLGLPVGTVNSRLARALADLRRLLEGEDE